MRGRQTFLLLGEGQTFFVGGGGGFDDVEEEIDVSEASKLFAGGPEILVYSTCTLPYGLLDF